MADPRDPEVMQLVDGELAPAEAAEAEAAIGRDPALRAKADGVRELTELVRGHLELTADAAEPRFARLWEQIEKRIEHDRTPVPAPVPARASSAAMGAAAPTGLFGRLGRFLDRRRAHIITAVVSAGAVAAIALVLRGRGDSDDPARGDRATIPVTPVLDHRPPEVESLDTPEGSGTVFTIEDEDGDAAVIWVEPADTVEGL